MKLQLSALLRSTGGPAGAATALAALAQSARAATTKTEIRLKVRPPYTGTYTDGPFAGRAMAT